MSIYFSLTEYVDWLALVSDNVDGMIPQGDEIVIDIEANSFDLYPGDYLGYVNVSTNIQENVQIPIHLTVGAVSISGDVNDDGQLNVLDIVQIVNYVLGNLEFNDSQILSADVNDDGLVNVLDIVTLVNMILTF
jgi:hypothetical protein